MTATVSRTIFIDVSQRRISIDENNWNRKLINSTAASSIYRAKQPHSVLLVFIFFRFKLQTFKGTTNDRETYLCSRA